MKIKRKATLGALYLGAALSLTGCKEKEEIRNSQAEEEIEISQEENRQEKNISLLNCQVLVENFPDGRVRHHFVNNNDLYDYILRKDEDKYIEKIYEYKGITDANFAVSYSEILYHTTESYGFDEIPETNGQYIFDYNVPYFAMSVQDLKLPNGYSISDLYSIEGLEKLEKELDASIYENRYTEFHPNLLLLAEMDGEYMCFDFGRIIYGISETTDKEDVTKLKNVYYVPCVNNNLLNLKVSSGMSAVEEKQVGFTDYDIFQNWKYEDVTSLDESVQNDYRDGILKFHDFYDYLTIEQQHSPTISKEEINEILDKLNEKENTLSLER